MVSKSLRGRAKPPHKLVALLMIIIHTLISLFLFFIPKFITSKRLKSVKDKIILVTGGGSGIGQLMVIKFLKLNAKVVVWDINESGMAKTKQMVQEQIPEKFSNLHCYHMDLSDRDSIYQTAEKVKKEIGTVSILVNNAGVVSGKPILDIPDRMIDLTFKVNSISHFYTTKAFLPDMIKQKYGHIAYVASIAGDIGLNNVTDYCASKFANVGMHEALDLEIQYAGLADQIKTTVVKPYLINTGMFAGTKSEMFQQLEPEYVAENIVLAVLREEKKLILPWYLAHIMAFTRIFPDSCFYYFVVLLGGLEAMDNFHGRQPITPTANDKTNDIINNNNTNSK